MIAAYKDMHAYPATVTFTDTYDIPDSQEPVKVAFLGNANTAVQGANNLADFLVGARPTMSSTTSSR